MAEAIVTMRTELVGKGLMLFTRPRAKRIDLWYGEIGGRGNVIIQLNARQARKLAWSLNDAQRRIA